MAGRVIRTERVNDPAREAEKKRLYGNNKPGFEGDQKYWAIARGKLVGVVVGWERVVPQITNCKKPVCYASFNSEAEAWSWLTETKKKLQRKLKKTRKVTRTRPKPGGKKGEEEEYETEEDYTSYEDTSEEELEKSKAPRRPAPPPPPKKIDEANVDTTWMGSQRYVTDKVWLVEEEVQAEEEEKEADVDLSSTPVAKSYTIGPNIGRGAFAVVKGATNNQSGAKVALKVLSSQISPDFNAAAVDVEVKALQAVRGHPNIVNFVESIQLPHGVVIALEQLGNPLLPFLAGENKPYHEDDAQKYIRHLVNAVEAIHAKGFVHRDIVPENLLLAPNGDLKLIGFSMVKEIKDQLPFDGLVGTPALQPPEVIMRQPIARAVDVWSIGCLTYALLSGKFPFQDSNVMRLNIKIRKAEYDLAGPEWGAVSSGAKDFIKAALNPDAKNRISAKDAKEHAWLKSNAPRSPLAQFRANLKATVDSNAWN